MSIPEQNTYLSQRDWDSFVETINHPTPPNEKLLRAAQRYRKAVTDGEIVSNLDEFPLGDLKE